jgi:hypothetical protein
MFVEPFQTQGENVLRDPENIRISQVASINVRITSVGLNGNAGIEGYVSLVIS